MFLVILLVSRIRSIIQGRIYELKIRQTLKIQYQMFWMASAYALLKWIQSSGGFRHLFPSNWFPNHYLKTMSMDDLILSGFRCAFSCVVQYSLCHGMDIGTCDIVHWSAAPHHLIAYRTGFWMCVVLVLNVFRCSCHYFRYGILFHRDFHHDSCDYWDFYGH